MKKIRILLVGWYDSESEIRKLNVKSDEEIRIAYPRYNNYYQKLPTLYSFHIVIFNPEWIEINGMHYFEKNIEKEKFDSEQFFNSPYPRCMVYPLVAIDDKLFNWLPRDLTFSTRFIEREGEDLIFNEKHWIYSFIKEATNFVEFSWKTHLETKINEMGKEFKQEYIATNLAGFLVSWEKKYKNGILLFFPYFEFNNRDSVPLFLRKLIDTIKSRLVKPVKSPPMWIENNLYKFDDERELEKIFRELSQKKEVYDKVRRILWSDGRELTESVAFVLKEIGFNLKQKEEDGREDIEISEPNFKAIIEVKGTKGYIGNEHLRQLLDWYNEKMIENPDINYKGILIVNHFKDADPSKREELCRQSLNSDSPFTQPAIKIAKRNGFCLMTTYQLFKLYKLVLNGKLNKDNIITMLNDTNGVFSEI